MVDELLSVERFTVDKKDNRECTPLHIACAGGNKDIVSSLITKGANLTMKNNRGMNPLQVAVVHKYVEVVEMILTNDMSPECKESLLKETDNDGNTTFLLAAKSGEEKMLEVLLSTGLVSKEDKNESGCNAFHLAAAINKPEIMEMICSYDDGSTDDFMNDLLLMEQDQQFRTPLHHAAKHAYDQVDTLQFLINK